VLSADSSGTSTALTGRLLPALSDVDAVLIRSATRMDAEALAAADRLKVVARAGIGLDNVDVPAATARGVMVVNAPTSNIVSAAEHAVALLLAVARNVPAADASLQAGQWKRSKFTGVEVADKTVGVVGLRGVASGRPRRHRRSVSAARLRPNTQPARRADRRPAGLETAARRATSSIHLPKTPETSGLIGARAGAGKPACGSQRRPWWGWCGARRRVRSGQVAGAGIDGCHRAGESPLGLPGVVSPHTWARHGRGAGQGRWRWPAGPARATGRASPTR
jgi:D-3-phosphoglycerate dehydrogenase